MAASHSHAERTLRDGFLRSAALHGDRPALEVAGTTLSYRDLWARAAAVAATLDRTAPAAGAPLTAVFGSRSITSFAGTLAALLRGHGYVPLNPVFPVDRTRAMLSRSDCSAVVVDEQSTPLLDEVLHGLDRPFLFVLPDADGVAALRDRWPRHSFLGANDLEEAEVWSAGPGPAPSAPAYLLFTSGSTGIPKGVAVSHSNVRAFLAAAQLRYAIHAEDRFSQTFDPTFDLSVFDMFLAWEHGACVCCPSAKSLINPGRFILDSRLSVWFSVPSTGVFMRRLGALKPARYPSLRWSLFCGEPLPAAVAEAWSAAAPNSIVENLYGPTEVTIACTVYRWDSRTSPAQCERGLVPIGEPLHGMSTLVADEALRAVPIGEPGELLMCGPQVTAGYWRDPEKTATAFVVPPGQAAVHYRTGDLVRRPAPDAPLVYLRRVDHQIKIQGHRVELGEIEAALREASGVDAAIALGWPITDSGAGGIVAFLGDAAVDVDAVLARVASRLPDYMVPRRLYARDSLPLNANGKYDRNALQRILEEMR